MDAWVKRMLASFLIIAVITVITDEFLPRPYNIVVRWSVLFLIAWVYYIHRERKRKGYGRNNPRDKYYKRKLF